MAKKRKKKLSDVGHNVPANFKFGLIVAAAIFWAEFLRNAISYLVNTYSDNESPLLVSFIIAVFFTILVWLILIFYVKIREKLEKIKIDSD